MPNFHKGNTHSPYDGFDFGSISLEPASPIATNRQQSPFLFAQRKDCLKPPQSNGDEGNPLMCGLGSPHPLEQLYYNIILIKIKYLV